MNGPIAQDALLSLALPSSSALRPSKSRRLTSLPSVAPTVSPRLLTDQHDLGLGIVPFRLRMDADFRAEPDRRHRLRLGEDLGVGSDAHFEILRPGTRVHERILHPLRLRRAGTHASSRSSPITATSDCRTLSALRRIASRVLLDDALQHARHERHAARLDRLQIAGRKEPRRLPLPCRSAAELARTSESDASRGRPVAARTTRAASGISSNPLAVGAMRDRSWSASPFDDDEGGARGVGQPHAPDEGRALAIGGQARRRREEVVHGGEAPIMWEKADFYGILRAAGGRSTNAR